MVDGRDRDWSNLQVFKWNGAVWEWLNGQWMTNEHHRIFRPKEEIVSAKGKNDSPLKEAYKPFTDLFPGVRTKPDYSKMPEGTRVVEPVDMYEVHKYIKENLTLERGFSESLGMHRVKLVLAGEVISEIEM